MSKAIRIVEMNATDAKNRFGRVLEAIADEHSVVSLTRHDEPAGYVIPPAMYHSFAAYYGIAKSELVRLDEEFTALVAAMQTPRSIQAAASLKRIDDATFREKLLKAAAKTVVTEPVASTVKHDTRVRGTTSVKAAGDVRVRRSAVDSGSLRDRRTDTKGSMVASHRSSKGIAAGGKKLKSVQSAARKA